ncbi:hypothetical protein HK405_005227, partial [Cladochytrium tenue]
MDYDEDDDEYADPLLYRALWDTSGTGVPSAVDAAAASVAASSSPSNAMDGLLAAEGADGPNTAGAGDGGGFGFSNATGFQQFGNPSDFGGLGGQTSGQGHGPGSDSLNSIMMTFGLPDTPETARELQEQESLMLLKRKRTTQACDGCNKKKIKCDGEKPSCGNCVRAGLLCSYARSARKRGPRSNYIESLENRLKEMEALLRPLEQQHQPPLSSAAAAASSYGYPPSAGGGATLSDAMDQVRSDSDSPAFLQGGAGGAATAAARNSSVPPHVWASSQSPELTTPSPPPTSGSVSGIPPDAAKDLVDVFFEYVYPFIPIVHRNTFMAGFAKESPLLLNAMYSLAARFSAHPSIRLNKDAMYTAGEAFYVKARQLVDHYMDVPTTSTVTALLLLASYAAGSGRGSAAWMYSGMAIRMAQELKLNIEPEFEESLSRVPNQNFFSYLVLLTKIFGKVVEYANSFKPSHKGGSGAGGGGRGDRFSSGFDGLSSAGRGAAGRVDGAVPANDMQLSVLDASLKEFFSNLPESIKSIFSSSSFQADDIEGPWNVPYIHIFYHTCMILLYRPKMMASFHDGPLPSVQFTPAFLICRSSASEVSATVQRVRATNEAFFHMSPFVGFCIFQTGLIHVMAGHLSSSADVVEESIRNADLHVTALEGIARYWFMAGRLHTILKTFVENARSARSSSLLGGPAGAGSSLSVQQQQHQQSMQFIQQQQQNPQQLQPVAPTLGSSFGLPAATPSGVPTANGMFAAHDDQTLGFLL